LSIPFKLVKTPKYEGSFKDIFTRFDVFLQILNFFMTH
jgi:hypothetical protein